MTPFPTATAIPPTRDSGRPCGGATAEITGLEKQGPPEAVTLSGSGDLTGWYLISVRGNQRFDFPSGFFLDGAVQILSATPSFQNSGVLLFWRSSNVWNNSSDDDAELYDCDGNLVRVFDDGM